MVEEKMTRKEVLKKYEIVRGKRPQRNDKVYVQSQGAVYTVKHVDGMSVIVERSHKGSGLILKLPLSQYQLLKEK